MGGGMGGIPVGGGRTPPPPGPDDLMRPGEDAAPGPVGPGAPPPRTDPDDILQPDFSRPASPHLPPDSRMALDWARVSGSREPVTPMMGSVGGALANNLDVVVTGRDGSAVHLTRAQLIEYARHPERLTRDFGIDPRDFSESLVSATIEGQRDATLDMTRAGDPLLYDGTDGNNLTGMGPGRMRHSDQLLALTSGGIEGAPSAFAGVEGEQGFWSMLWDIICEIFTLGFADTRLFNSPDVWRDNAAGAAMAGGPALRQAVLGATTDQAREQLVTRLAAQCERAGLSPADARAAARHMLDDLRAFYQRPGVDDAFLTAAQTMLLRAGPNAFGGMTPGAYLDAFVQRASGDPAAMQAMTRLMTSADFNALSPRAQGALMMQALHNPNTTNIETMTRLAGAHWFRHAEPADQERGARVLAYNATFLHRSVYPPQREILRHTLDWLLPPTGTGALVFADVQPGTSGVTGGWTNGGHGSTIYLNRALTRDGTSPVDDNGSNRWSMIDALAHEVNHNLNGDSGAATHDYFMGEYGAWYVGFVAANGREPTRAEAYDRCVYLLTRTDGVYDNIRRARLATGPDGSPGPEARRMIAFMSQFAGTPIDPTSAGAGDRAVHISVANAGGPAPQPDVVRNMDNDPAHPMGVGGGGGTHHHHH